MLVLLCSFSAQFSAVYLKLNLIGLSGERMKDILLYLSNGGFLSAFIKTAVAGVISGFGFGMILSLIGYSSYKTFNLLERSID